MPQKHSTIRNGKRLVWYTEKLWMQSRDLSPFEIDISSIKELDEDCWFGQKKPTLREIARHCKKINNVSLKYSYHSKCRWFTHGWRSSPVQSDT